MHAIRTSGLTKRYGDTVALDGIDLGVERGEVFGFLGSNGAGKSTTINMLLDFVRPTAGEVRVLGHDAGTDPRRIRARTGVLPEDVGLFRRLTGRQHVAFAVESKAAGDDPDALLDRVGLSDAGDRRAGGYSTGMRQRLALAMALVGQPDLLIFDEPSTGLDPNGARRLLEIVREERDRGATVFLSSHVLGQVEAVCDRVGILRAGQLVAVDTVDQLRHAVGAGTRVTVTVNGSAEGAAAVLREVEGTTDVWVEDDRVVADCEGRAARAAVLARLSAAELAVADVTTDGPSLEALFAAYTAEDRSEAAV